MRRSAKIFVANETSSEGGLRCRSRSCSRASSEEEFYSPAVSRGHFVPPKVSGSPSSLNRSTPGYGLKYQGSRYVQDVDSGFLDDSNQSERSGEFKSSSLLTKLAEKSSHMVSPDVKENIRDLKKRWRKYNSALYTSGPVRSGSMKINDILPIVVMIITLGSAIFTVYMLTNALNKANRNRNGKYDSIQYAHDGTVSEDSIYSMTIVDENGVPLGGKKASIQFAYNLRQKREQAEKVEQGSSELQGLTDEEIINRLTLKVANDVMKIYDGAQADNKGLFDDKKERLLKKIGEFGHFGTSAVEPLDLDKVIEEKTASKNSLEEIQKEPVGASKNDLENIAAEMKPEAASKNQILEKSEKTDIVQPKADKKPVKTKAGKKPAKRNKRDASATGEISMKQNPFRINADLTSAVVRSEDDPFRFIG